MFTNGIHTLTTLHGLISLVILTVLELVLGIDNIVFISLVIAKLPEEKQSDARVAGLSMALLMRLVLLGSIVWISHISTVLFAIAGFEVTIRDVLFFVGGAYLVINTVSELQKHLARKENDKAHTNIAIKNIVLQIMLVEMLFSFDTIFTAIGITYSFVIMAIAIILGMLCMLYVSAKISAFINKYPTIKIIALGFIIAVGLILVASAFHIELPRNYIYAAFFLAFGIEILNIQLRNYKK